MKKLAVAAAAGLMLVAVSTAVVLASHASGNGQSGIHLSAATGNSSSAGPDQTAAEEQSEAAENGQVHDEQGEDEQQEDTNEQGANEQRNNNQQNDHRQGGATNQRGDDQPRAAGQSER